MKRWISPPIQLLLWLGGIACLAASASNLWELRQVTVAQHMARGDVQVAIPDAKALDVPGINSYLKLVEAPLFWEERAIPEPPPPPPPPPVAVKPPPPKVIEVPLNPPAGRLVGIVDLGEKRYALVRNETENQSLYEGDTWEGWRVTSVDAGKVVLAAGTQSTEISLIGDFVAPKPNKQLLAANQRRQHQQRQKHLRIQRQQQQQQGQSLPNTGTQTQPAAADGQQADSLRTQLKQALNGGNPQDASQGQPTPVLSIKEALAARQRLMASRWGKNKK